MEGEKDAKGSQCRVLVREENKKRYVMDEDGKKIRRKGVYMMEEGKGLD